MKKLVPLINPHYLLFGGLLVVLAACVSQERQTVQVEVSAAAQQSDRLASSSSDSSTPVKTDVTQRVSVVPDPIISVDDDPDQFLALEPKALAAKLGPPRQIRRDGTAEVWQFAGEGCFVDMFLYPASAGDAPQVQYVDLRGDGLTLTARRACLADLLRDQIKNTG